MSRLFGGLNIPCSEVSTCRATKTCSNRSADEIYLDHAGTTLYAKSLMERFATDMISNLYGNPHSTSSSSQATTERVENTRMRVLEFFRADPAEFDVVFVANATAGIKLVMDSFRAEDGFGYGYHKDSHNSLIGVREVASVSKCLDDDAFEQSVKSGRSLFPGRAEAELQLYAYPAQSNFDGRRLPLSWCHGIRHGARNCYVLLDAAALVSTSQLDLSNAETAPDFTVVSFNKVFGFPDLGALLVRKSRGDILRRRKYFGGGTVEVVVALESEQWHIPRTEILHESLEDGTLPIHNIMALNTAMKVHKELFKSMDMISEHTTFLAEKLYSGLKALKHANGTDVCRLYPRDGINYGNKNLQGPIVPFNIMNSQGAWMSNTEVQRVAAVRKIHIRTGGMCNPGGVAEACDFAPWELSRNFLAGARCGGDFDVVAGKPLGVIRASLGAMSSVSDVGQLIAFVDEFYAEKYIPPRANENCAAPTFEDTTRVVQSLTVYPVKSCAGYMIPAGLEWDVNPEGLAWDREWCFINQSNGQVLSQKKYPKMALIRPDLRIKEGFMTLCYKDIRIDVPLSSAPSFYESNWTGQANVCVDKITTWRLKNFEEGNAFFSDVLGVPCYLARFPTGGSGPAARHTKAHLQKHLQPNTHSMPGAHIDADVGILTPPRSDDGKSQRPILLSNESPILLINSSSVSAVNKEIAGRSGKPADNRVFRANIVISSNNDDRPYAEDDWSSIRIGQQDFTMLGSCRRCHMICIDQQTAEKNSEPFLTLAKTRKMDGKVWFGCHMCHNPKEEVTREGQRPTIRVGDPVVITGVVDE